MSWEEWVRIHLRRIKDWPLLPWQLLLTHPWWHVFKKIQFDLSASTALSCLKMKENSAVIACVVLRSAALFKSVCFSLRLSSRRSVRTLHPHRCVEELDRCAVHATDGSHGGQLQGPGLHAGSGRAQRAESEGERHHLPEFGRPTQSRRAQLRPGWVRQRRSRSF